MKVTISKESVIDQFKAAAAIIPTRGAQHFQSLWLRSDAGGLSIMTTDSAVEYAATCPARVESPGMVGAAGKALVDLVTRFPAGDITLHLDEDAKSLRVQQGRRKYAVPIIGSEWFAGFEPFPEAGGVLWSGDLLREIIEQISFCVSDDKDIGEIGCLCINARAESIDVCGLNGHMFAMRSLANDDLHAIIGAQNDARVLIQRRYIQEVRKWLPAGEVDLAFSNGHMYLRTPDGRETLRVPRALLAYPDYNVFLGKVRGEGTSRLSINRKDMIDALDRLKLFNSVENRSVVFDLSAESVTISVPDAGEATEELFATYDGALSRIAFPTSGLMEILGHFTSKTVCMTLTSEEGPCGVTGEHDTDYLVIVMPMKIADEKFYNEDDV